MQSHQHESYECQETPRKTVSDDPEQMAHYLKTCRSLGYVGCWSILRSLVEEEIKDPNWHDVAVVMIDYLATGLREVPDEINIAMAEHRNGISFSFPKP